MTNILFSEPFLSRLDKVFICTLSVLGWLSVAACGSSHSPSVAPTAAPSSPVHEQSTMGSAAPATKNDPFEYLAKGGPEAASWEGAQTTRSIEFLHGQKGFDDLFRKAQAYRSARQPPKQMDVRGKTTFAIEKAEGDTSIITRRTAGKASVVLFRTDGGASHRVNLDFISASPAGKFIAVGVSEGGDEETQVRILDANTGRDIGERSEDVRLQQLVWLPDDTGYFYMRGRGRKGVPVADQNKHLNIALHSVGKPSDGDVEIVGSRARGKRIHADLEYCYPALSSDGKDVVVGVRHGLNPEVRIFTKRRDAIADERVEWQELYGDKDRVTSYAVGYGRIVVAMAGGANGNVVEQLDLKTPSTRRVLYKSSLPVNEVLVAGNDTYVVETHIATKQLVSLARENSSAPVPLPEGSSVVTESIRTDADTRQLLLQLRSWTDLPSWWLVSKGRAKPAPDVNEFGTVKNSFRARTIHVDARDGEKIPVTIVGPKDDLSAPRFVLATAYGSYGFVVSPSFTPTRRIFLDLGGTFVFVHVRGGGEKGKIWHDGGRGVNKAKTIEDLIDVMKALRAQGFGKDGGIMLSGSSAGAIPVGGLLDREPELVQAVAIESGVTNVTQLEGASSTGALHKEEFGSKDTPDGELRLREIDAYLNIKDGVKYPATIVIAGANDVRVPKWQSSKFVARLQQAQAGDQPILLRLTGGGHVSGNTRDEDSAVGAEWLALGLTRIGHPDFQ
ncbi:MAG: S9 family peptidase [Verrucomicrobiaceae bacterium]|nr:MAG: S9 family peptidase [Verrucomicrobiaceae bacterium]